MLSHHQHPPGEAPPNRPVGLDTPVFVAIVDPQNVPEKFPAPADAPPPADVLPLGACVGFAKDRLWVRADFCSQNADGRGGSDFSQLSRYVVPAAGRLVDQRPEATGFRTRRRPPIMFGNLATWVDAWCLTSGAGGVSWQRNSVASKGNPGACSDMP